MANEPARLTAAIPTSTGPTWQLVCQLSEEVGFLRGTLLGLQYADAECLDSLVKSALQHHEQLSAIRRTFSITVDGRKRDEAGNLCES